MKTWLNKLFGKEQNPASVEQVNPWPHQLRRRTRNERFLSPLHMHVRKPEWTEEDFQKLLTELQHRGYGWLRPEGVRHQLEKMTVEWNGPPPLPWERGS